MIPVGREVGPYLKSANPVVLQRSGMSRRQLVRMWIQGL